MPLDVLLPLIEGDGPPETDVLVARFFFGVTRGLSAPAAEAAAEAAAALARKAAAPDIAFGVLSGLRDPLLTPARGLGCLVCAGAALAGTGRVGAAFFRRAGLLALARVAATGADL